MSAEPLSANGIHCEACDTRYSIKEFYAHVEDGECDPE